MYLCTNIKNLLTKIISFQSIERHCRSFTRLRLLVLFPETILLLFVFPEAPRGLIVLAICFWKTRLVSVIEKSFLIKHVFYFDALNSLAFSEFLQHMWISEKRAIMDYKSNLLFITNISNTINFLRKLCYNKIWVRRTHRVGRPKQGYCSFCITIEQLEKASLFHVSGLIWMWIWTFKCNFCWIQS